MSLRTLLPPNLLLLARYVRTQAILRGWLDPDERARRLDAIGRIRLQQPGPPTGRRVLVFSFRGWYPHAAWDALLAHSLRLRGASVHMFVCGGPLPICEVNFRHASPALACTECALYPKELVQGFSLPHSNLRNYLSADEQRTIARHVAELPPEHLESWHFAGQPVGELVRTSVLWFARKSDLNLSGPDGKVYRDFLISGAAIALAAPRILAAVNPDVVIELNGQFFAERIFNRFVPESTHVVAYEAGWRTNTLGFDRVSGAGPVDLDAVWSQCRGVKLSARQDQQLHDWTASRLGGDMQRDFYLQFSRDTVDPLISLGLRLDLPTAVLFTNLVWDTAVQGRDRAFASIRHWLLQTVADFDARRDRQLVIRIHPAEDLRPSQESVEKLSDVLRSMPTLPPNVRVVGAADQTNSYTLMDRCQVTIVYNSTVGLEAALRAKPVIVAARVYYAERGFTSDVADLAAYPAMLDDAFASGPIPEEKVELARRFAHLLMFRYLHKIPVVRQRPGQLPLLESSEIDWLVPGTVPEFDRLLSSLAAGHDFVTEPAGESSAYQ